MRFSAAERSRAIEANSSHAVRGSTTVRGRLSCHLSIDCGQRYYHNVVSVRRTANHQSCAEIKLWPHAPRVETDPAAGTIISHLACKLAGIPITRLSTLSQLGDYLGVGVVLAPLKPPRQAWTWFARGAPLVEVADWLEPELGQMVLAHEICHVLLGPPPARHDYLTERVCNWGSNQIIRRLGDRCD